MMLLFLITNPNKTHFITPGIADSQRSSIFQDQYPAEALLESNGLWDRVGLEQQAKQVITSLCSRALIPVHNLQVSKKSQGFSHSEDE